MLTLFHPSAGRHRINQVRGDKYNSKKLTLNKLIEELRDYVNGNSFQPLGCGEWYCSNFFYLEEVKLVLEEVTPRYAYASVPAQPILQVSAPSNDAPILSLPSCSNMKQTDAHKENRSLPAERKNVMQPENPSPSNSSCGGTSSVAHNAGQNRKEQVVISNTSCSIQPGNPCNMNQLPQAISENHVNPDYSLDGLLFVENIAEQNNIEQAIPPVLDGNNQPSEPPFVADESVNPSCIYPPPAVSAIGNKDPQILDNLVYRIFLQIIFD